jgi:putative glutamine amidotransferase
MRVVSIIANSTLHEKIPKREDYNVPFFYLEKLKNASKKINKSNEILFIILPYDIEKINHYVKISDAMLSIGGDDINPTLYSEENKFCNRINDLRYEFENLLIKEFLKTNKPFFGICAGMQILNVTCGGSLHQDIENEIKIENSHCNKFFEYGSLHHEIQIKENSKLYSIFKQKTIRVNSYHHQGIKVLANNLIATAFSEDNLIEAIEAKDHRFCIGVQWHPEFMDETDNLFTDFLQSLFI